MAFMPEPWDCCSVPFAGKYLSPMAIKTAAASLTTRRLTRGSIEERGRKWFNRFRIELTNATTGEVTVSQQRMELGEFRSAAAAGAHLDKYLAILQADGLLAGPTVTAREYFARFDQLAVALMRPESQRNFRSIIREHLEPALGAKPLTAIDAAALQELVAALHGQGLARATVSTIISRMLQVLRHARASDYSAHLISRRQVKMPSSQLARRERRHITEEQLQAILTASSGDRRTLWAVLGYAGLRIGEALGLRRQDVDLAAGALLVRQAAVAGQIAPLKTRTATRDIPLLPELQAILAEFLPTLASEPGALLFARRTGRPRTSGEVRRRWLAPLLKQLHLPPAGCHAFRHGLPGRLDALQLSPGAIQRFMGHATLTQTEHYLHRSTSDLREQLTAALRRRDNTQQVSA
jgi:integrase